VIEEGASVRERQAIINLPDVENMKIDARIHESKISRIVGTARRNRN
jgi:HlyD family secretion protein